MSTTARALIQSAMQKCGILTLAQAATNDEANDALSALNAMLSSWSNDSLLCYARTWETFNLVGGQQEYAIGTGAADFNTARPIDIVQSYVRINNISDMDLVVVNDEIFTGQIAMKSAPGIPKWLNYDNGYPTANVRLWPVPSSSYQIFLLTEKPLSSFTIDSTIDLPPGWERALIFNLPFEIAGDYGQEVPDTVQKIAADSKKLIKNAIQKNRSLDAFPQQGSPNNIYTGWNR